MNKIAIHQSQYLPWPPYFKKIAHSDIFVVLDNVQFQKNGLQNRNKIRGKERDFWLTVPVNQSLDENINEKRIINKIILKKHWKSIEQSYSNAPYWKAYSSDLRDIFLKDYEFLVTINQDIMMFIMKELGINTKVVFSSDVPISSKKNQLIIDLCNYLQADQYISGTGASNYLINDMFSSNGIQLVYMESTPPNYYQNSESFIPGLSMLDYIFYCSKEEINKYFN